MDTGTKYNPKGFDIKNIHKDTGTEWDLEGYNAFGYNEKGYDRDGFNEMEYDEEEYNRKGYNAFGYNRDGYDINGMYLEVFDKNRKKKIEELENLIEEDQSLAKTIDDLLVEWEEIKKQEENEK